MSAGITNKTATSAAMRPTEKHLIEYGMKLIAMHPGPRWRLKEALAANLRIWSDEYGEAIAAKARDALNKALKERKEK
jgi:hypothetical protein